MGAFTIVDTLDVFQEEEGRVEETTLRRNSDSTGVYMGEGRGGYSMSIVCCGDCSIRVADDENIQARYAVL